MKHWWLLPCIALLVLGASCSAEVVTAPAAQPGDAAQPDAYDLLLSVQSKDGTTNEASVRCLGNVVGSGYLRTGAASGNACVTAMTSPAAVQLLKLSARGEPLPCDQLRPFHDLGAFVDQTAAVALTGKYEGRPIALELEMNNPCHQEVAWILEPLFQPADQPRIVELAE